MELNPHQEGQDSSSHTLIQKYMCVMKLYRGILEKQLNKTGVYRSQHQILMYIARNPNASQKEIAKRQRVSTATIAVSLKKLEKGGYINRVADQKDNRFNQICITEKGQNIVEHSAAFFKQVEDQMFEGFTVEEYERLGEYFDQIYDNLLRLIPETEREDNK